MGDIIESTHNIVTGPETQLIINWCTHMVDMLLTLVSTIQCSDKLGLGKGVYWNWNRQVHRHLMSSGVHKQFCLKEVNILREIKEYL